MRVNQSTHSLVHILLVGEDIPTDRKNYSLTRHLQIVVALPKNFSGMRVSQVHPVSGLRLKENMHNKVLLRAANDTTRHVAKVGLAPQALFSLICTPRPHTANGSVAVPSLVDWFSCSSPKQTV